MKTANSVLMKQARETLKGRWGLAIGTLFLYQIVLIVIGSVPKVGSLVSLLVSGPLALGATMFALSFSRNTNPKTEQIFEGFQRFTVALCAYLLMGLFTLLWFLLLIVPGIIAALSYSMTFYIIADDHSVSAFDAIDRSKKMMKGNKWKLFCLGCRFIGWALLCILTLGIGFFWLMPYMTISVAKFYEDIKNMPATPAVA